VASLAGWNLARHRKAMEPRSHSTDSRASTARRETTLLRRDAHGPPGAARVVYRDGHKAVERSFRRSSRTRDCTMAVDTFMAYVGVYDAVADAEADYEFVKDLHTEANLMMRSTLP
jgi:hypothetical protein